MKKLLVLLFMLCICIPAFAQHDPPAFPGLGDTEFVGDLTWTYTSDERARSINGTWFHMTGARQKTGITLFGARSSGNTGAGVGPAYQVMLGRFAKGAMWGGGALFANGADLSDLATGSMNLDLNYELYLGRVAAFRVGMRYAEAIDVKDPTAVAAAGIDGITTLYIGFGVWPGPAAPVN